MGLNFPSYKFHRLFPLSQYDLPTHNPDTLSFPRPQHPRGPTLTARPSVAPTSWKALQTPLATPGLPAPAASSRATYASMTPDQIALNPAVDYTRQVLSEPYVCTMLIDARAACRPYLISLVFSDVGILTPEGVSQYLVGMFAG